MLVLTDVTLLWSFLPTIPGQDKAQPITNEVSSSVKVLNQSQVQVYDSNLNYRIQNQILWSCLKFLINTSCYTRPRSDFVRLKFVHIL